MTKTIHMDLVSWSGVPEQATWAWWDEYGTLQSMATGDVTAIMQSAVNKMAKGFAVEIAGQSYDQTSGGAAPFLCTFSAISLPPCVAGSLIFHNVIWLSRPTDGGVGWFVDSCEDLRIQQIGGQFLYRGNTAALRVKPTNRTVTDNALACDLLKMDLHGVTAQSGTNPITIDFDPSLGSIQHCDLNFGEVDDQAGAPQTIRISDPSATTVFSQNRIRAGLVFGSTSAIIQCGLNPTDPNNANICGNTWDIGTIQGYSGSSPDGFNTFGKDETLIIGQIGGPNSINHGLMFEPSTSNIHYRVGRFVNCATPVFDFGTGNTPF